VAADTAHLLAMAVWLAGLVLVFAGVLAVGRDEPVADAMAVVSRFSRLAMAAVAVLVVTGILQAWRVLGANPLRGGEYTQLLVFKLAAFGVLLCLAAASRSAIRRRYPDVGAVPAARGAVATGTTATGTTATGTTAATRTAAGAGVVVKAPVVTKARTATTVRAARPGAALRRRELAAMRLLRRSVLIELAIGAVILGLTAALVSTSPSAHGSTQPGATPYRGPFSTVLPLSGGIQVQIWIDPAASGQNQMVAGVRDATGAARDVPEVRAAFSRPALGVDRLAIVFTREGPGQFVARNAQVPVPGPWRLDLWVRTSEVDEVSGSTTVPFA
jgi:copper transport protein